MSEGSDHMQETIHKAIYETIKNAASKQNLSIHADAVGVVSQRGCLCVNTPVTGIENVDVKTLLDAGGPLDDKPIMLLYLSGEQFAQSKSLPVGYYTIVAHAKEGTVTLQNSTGKVLGQGLLLICVSKPPKEVAFFSVSGGVDSIKVGKNSFKICGHVEVKGFGGEISVSGCIEVQH
jgi:hypothetical protein